MIKECMWKGRSISCSAIFAMQPTDRGMCCSFNKERAEEMFRESRYQEQIVRMTHQDESRSEEDSKMPEWFVCFLSTNWKYSDPKSFYLGLTLHQRQASPGAWT